VPVICSGRDMTDLDQFYTRPDLAEIYARQILARWRNTDVLFVEPSAGTGAFVRPLRDAGCQVRAVDIAPAAENIVERDFLQDHDIYRGAHSAIVTVGNPPFGKNASIAVRFFNRAAIHSDEIAFIVPRTFRKLSLQKRLNPRFHLVHDEDVGRDAFILCGGAHDVPCAWQIWARMDRDRPVPQVPCVARLVNYTIPSRADFAMRRVGYYAGRIITGNLPGLSATTHYFMQERAPGTMEALRSINWSEIASQTAGARSLSKAEIAIKLNEVCGA